MSEPRRGRVLHAIPGRMRVKLQREELTEEFGRELDSALLALPGVRHVGLNPQSCSLLIFHDPAAIDTAGLIERIQGTGLLTLEELAPDRMVSKPASISLSAQGIHRAFQEVDARLYGMTDGRWDLRSVFPAALGVLAVRQLLARPGALTSAPWYVLAWYAFDSFWKLNQAGPEPSQAAAEHGDPGGAEAERAPAYTSRAKRGKGASQAGR